MSVPLNALQLMLKSYKYIFPTVNEQLSYWKERARQIPDPELRKQALDSIELKTFHCEGGSIISLLAPNCYKEIITFIVAYQTISDYLDNLCDRSTSLDPEDFKALHESMLHSISLEENLPNYYRYRDHQDDGGYLHELVKTCQAILKTVPAYSYIKDDLIELCQYYCDLQIHKHVVEEKRIPRLMQWFNTHKHKFPPMDWYEFSASAGSTLGIFCLVTYAFRNDFKEEHSRKIKDGYFPFIQGLHILLDYFIDQEEDRLGGDLNFCFYYKNEEEMFERFLHFIREAEKSTSLLPHAKFHQLISDGLLGIYLSDEKTNSSKKIKKLAKKLLKEKGFTSYFFYLNGKLYRKMKTKFL